MLNPDVHNLRTTVLLCFSNMKNILPTLFLKNNSDNSKIIFCEKGDREVKSIVA